MAPFYCLSEKYFTICIIIIIIITIVNIVFINNIVFVCSEQAAGRQRASGGGPGELISAGSGQPVFEHQERLSPRHLE